MKKVILLRHAKSRWDDPATDDHDRPLNKRGKAAAPIIGRWLADRGYLPDTVLCSSSARTTETVRRMRKTMPGGQTAAELHDVMLVGHNPGLGSLVRKMADGREDRRCRRAFEHFPTGAAAVLELDLDRWSEIGFGEARFVDFASPRELMEA
jgi:phosphohistidine phosphatase